MDTQPMYDAWRTVARQNSPWKVSRSLLRAREPPFHILYLRYAIDKTSSGKSKSDNTDEKARSLTWYPLANMSIGCSLASLVVCLSTGFSPRFRSSERTDNQSPDSDITNHSLGMIHGVTIALFRSQQRYLTDAQSEHQWFCTHHSQNTMQNSTYHQARRRIARCTKNSKMRQGTTITQVITTPQTTTGHLLVIAELVGLNVNEEDAKMTNK